MERATKLLALHLVSSGEPLSVRLHFLCGTLKTHICFVTTLLLVEGGDLFFQAPRRFWSRTAVAPSYAYIFTDHQPGADPVLGVNHTAELSYLFGGFAFSGPPKHPWLSQVMLDYWISFAVSLTPNDGKGMSSTYSLLIRVDVVFVLLILSSGPHWGMYGETKVRFQALLNGMKTLK
jgi:hypothetical protein